MKQRTEITFEVEETLVVKQKGGKTISTYCPRCCKDVEMLSPPVLSVVTGSTEREIFRLVEAGLIHFVEAKRIYACPDCCGRVFTSTDPPRTEFRVAKKLQ